jgi:hypothetical protein
VKIEREVRYIEVIQMIHYESNGVQMAENKTSIEQEWVEIDVWKTSNCRAIYRAGAIIMRT